ncbi:MAG: hypothetical protein KDA58_12260 [Planctomycetaceae bacterium]|nr:hypothetical protein [Planctomycetaceae bacterium]
MVQTPEPTSSAPDTAQSFSLWRDARHLFILGIILAGVGYAGIQVRQMMLPEGFGTEGPYRAAAIDEIKARPSLLVADTTCLECHTDVKDEREGTLHEAVACMHCHGFGREHVELARAAAEDPSKEIPAAQEWDGDFFTKIDLFTTEDRRTCLACHEQAIGMPADFKKIDVAFHLEDMGAEEPKSPNVCFECHGGHDTAP